MNNYQFVANTSEGTYSTIPVIQHGFIYVRFPSGESRRFNLDEAIALVHIFSCAIEQFELESDD